ncbi:unnamed protein product [Oreochromis niloticus]|nr:unnamed protein product [Mustela putorius furo]
MRNITLVSMNVNGMNNPIKRSKVILKMRKLNANVIYLQETHLSQEEHDKLKKFGYRNSYYSTCKKSRKRGVAILIKNSVNFECSKEIRDSEGRYIIVRGKLEGEAVTLINLYIPPESNQQNVKTLLTTVMSESEGTVLCAGDFNVVLDHRIDTTSTNGSKKSLARMVNTFMKEQGMVDVWREHHPLDKEYTHYSKTHNTYSRIDYVLMNRWDLHRVNECTIGVADISDHCAIHLKLNLNSRRRHTCWRLNLSCLNKKETKDQIKKDIKQYIEENSTEEISPTVFWDAFKAVLRGKLIAITSKQHQMRKALYLSQVEELKNTEILYRTTRNVQLQDRIKTLKKEIDNILTEEVEKKLRFLKQDYYENGPKAARLLARRLRQQQAANTIHKIRDPSTNNLQYSQEAIEETFRKYYENLYKQPCSSNKDEKTAFLNSLDLPRIGTQQNSKLTAPISHEEISRAISRLKANKSPGADGFPSEWYKNFKEELIPMLQSSFNHTLAEGVTPPSWREAIISVIPKEGKDTEYCNNYRPVSVLNVDYKIYTSIIAKRYGAIIRDLINEDQTGFISGRRTQDSIRRTLQIVNSIQTKKGSAALVSLDAEKAFDSVDWNFLYAVLERFGFNDNAVMCIKSIYQSPTARIRINGSLTEQISLERGTRQGCCLSPLLFAIYIEPLAQAIRQSEEVRGINIKGEDHIISLFADDIILYLENPNQTLIPMFNVINIFAEHSGYKVNVTKTQILAFNYLPSEEVKNKFKLNWTAKQIKYLGVTVTKQLSDLLKTNYDRLTTQIKHDLNRWSTLTLDFSARITTIKMSILPRLLYLFQSLPVKIPVEKFKDWDRLISRFVWNGKRPRIKYTTLQLSRKQGGVGLPNLKDYYHAAQTRPAIKWCDQNFNAKWKDIEIKVQDVPVQTFLGNEQLKKTLQHFLDPITSHTLEIWFGLVKQSKLEREVKMLNWAAYVVGVIPSAHDSGFRKWEQKGITAICTIMKDGHLMSFQDLKDRYSLEKTDFYRYLQLRDYFSKEVRSPRTSYGMLDCVIKSYRGLQFKEISVLYKNLRENTATSTEYIKKKWEQEIKTDISTEEWLDMCETQNTTTNSRCWREFGWKHLTRFFITPKIKSKQTQDSLPCWRRCGNMEAHHTHIFWECLKLHNFWKNVTLVIGNILGYQLPHNFKTVYLGNIREYVMYDDMYLTKILLIAAKKAITRNWYKLDPPSSKDWLNVVGEIYAMEKMTYILRLKEDIFVAKWEKWTLYGTKEN